MVSDLFHARRECLTYSMVRMSDLFCPTNYVFPMRVAKLVHLDLESCFGPLHQKGFEKLSTEMLFLYLCKGE